MQSFFNHVLTSYINFYHWLNVGGKPEQAMANIVLPVEGGNVSVKDAIHNIMEAARVYANGRVIL